MPKPSPKTSEKKRLVVLDAHAIIHRAYHALPDFATKSGVPTGALYGIVSMLFKAITDLSPDYIVAAYDLPGATFRHDAYQDYKAGRREADPALIAQFKSSRELFEAFGIPIYDYPGFEADDIIGTIASLTASDKNLSVMIVSGDMDTLQLVEKKRVEVFTLKKGINDTIIYDEDAVKERYGFSPASLPDYKGLRGDPSDNIIGVPGIGEKTATTLVSHFGTIEKLYAALEKNTEKVKALKITDRIIELLRDHKDEAVFSKELATIRRDAPISFSLPTATFRDCLSVGKVRDFLMKYEFRSHIPRLERICGETVEEVFGDAPRTTGSFNVPKDVFERLAIALWLLDSSRATITESDIEAFAKGGGLEGATKAIEEAIDKNGLGFVYRDMELAIMPVVNQMCETGIRVNVPYLRTLSDEYHKSADAIEKNIWRLAGHEFNIASPKQLADVLFDELALSPESGKLKKTAGGARSTRESELKKLEGSHPIIAEILRYREVTKLLSTYIDVLPNLVADDGRIHARFIQRGTTTGRFSSDNPNLQNLPIKSELGKNIRAAFVASPETTLVSLDYSQIELRIAALLSQDPFMLKTFREGKDIHAAVASKVFHVAESEVTHEMRRRAKVINFGILYGMGVTALRENLGTDRKEAQAFHDNYFAEFPTIAGYLESVKEAARTQGYTTTLFGRRRYFPDIKSRIPFIRAAAERMAINAPIQGTATADLVKLAIRDIDRALEAVKAKGNAKLLMQIHDELVYEVADAYVSDFISLAEHAMTNVIPPEFLKGIESVPLAVGVGTGPHYGALK